MTSVAIRYYGARRTERFARGNRGVLSPAPVGRLDSLLNALDRADSLPDLELTGARPHALKGDHNGFLALGLSGNWRLDRRFNDADA